MDEQPSVTHRAQRARSLGALFAAGGLLSLLVMVLPGWSGSTPGIMTTSTLALLCAAVLFRWAPRVRRWAVISLLLAGTCLIAAAQYLAGSTNPAGFATLYVWIALFAAAYLSVREVSVQLAVATAAHATVLVALGSTGPVAPRLLLTLGTQTATAVVVGRLARHLRDLADTDPLTGATNRRGAHKALADALARGERHPQEPICVATIDLNDFKDVNDESGHAAGDEVLVELADAWRLRLRDTDTLARTGGDEFLVVMPDCDVPQARAVVERLLAVPARVSASAGVARWDGAEAADALLARADRALYLAKDAGPVVVVAG